MHERNAHRIVCVHTKRARISGLFYFAMEEGSSSAIHQLPLSSAGRLFLRLLLSLAFSDFPFSLFLGFLFGLALGYLLLGFALGFFLGLFLSLALGYFLFSLFLGFLLHYPPFLLGGFFPFRCAALFRRCPFLRCYFPLLSDLSLRSFFTRLLFGSHAFLRVGYPELSIYNKGKKTSNLAARTSQNK